MAKSFLAMKTGPAAGASEASQALLESDLRELTMAARKLANHAIVLGGGALLPGSLILLTVVAPAIFADTFRGSWLIIGVGVCLVIGCYLLHEHIKASGGLKEAFQKPNGWSNTIGILLLFIYPLPGSLILLTVVAPSLFADHFRNDLVGVFICLAIGCYLLQEHIRVSGGFREAFRKANGVSNTIGIVLLFVYPVWVLVLWLLSDNRTDSNLDVDEES
uniref:Uncharacterized protein n=1 Tax=Aegilops tauschii TaxID=37682 RepID=N1R3G0_AEGTA